MICGFLILMAIDIAYPYQPDIFLEIHQSPDYRGPVYFLAPHENEHVVNKYLIEQVRKKGGRFIILRQRGDRHLRLTFQEHEFEVDPNRIFTPLGARRSLLRLNPGLDEASSEFARAHQRAVDIGLMILGLMGEPHKGTIWIAVHNNTDGFDGDGKGGLGTVSIERYRLRLQSGAKYIKSLNQGKGDEDDLFFITSPSDFELMRQAGWNTVLQHPQVAWLEGEDDGSLSVLAEKVGVRYINIEAQRKAGEDHLDIQQRMVDFVFDLVLN